MRQPRRGEPGPGPRRLSGVPPADRPVVVMGASGSGKTTVGEALAAHCHRRFVDADDLHPPQNRAKMRRGEALDDEDRWPWLDRVGEVLAEGSVTGATSGPGGVVVACSALRRAYRDRLRAAAPGVVFIHLHGPKELLASRVDSRYGHFMPAALLDSQLATLEPLQPDEAGGVVEIGLAPEQQVARAARLLDPRGGSAEAGRRPVPG